MADENQIEAADTATATKEPSKRAVSKREILDSAGKEQDDWAGASGFRYTTLSDGFAATVMFDDLPDEIVKGLAAFGGLRCHDFIGHVNQHCGILFLLIR